MVIVLLKVRIRAGFVSLKSPKMIRPCRDETSTGRQGPGGVAWSTLSELSESEGSSAC